MADFRQLAREAVRRYGGTKQDLARRVGVAPSALSRFLSGAALPDITTCLLLASAAGLDPSALLRAAKHGEVAGAIEGLYGSAATRRKIPPDDVALLAAWHTLSPKHQRAFRILIAALARR